MMKIQHGLRSVCGDRSVLSRRSILGLALMAPFAGVPARAAELVTFADIAVADDQYTEKARKLAGKAVEMRGYMAPPLKPEIDTGIGLRKPSSYSRPIRRVGSAAELVPIERDTSPRPVKTDIKKYFITRLNGGAFGFQVKFDRK